MNKEELLQELKVRVSTHEISQDEVLHALAIPTTTQLTQTSSEPAHFAVTKIFYAIGAAIAVIGVCIFVSQIWSDLGSAGRILVTLGVGLAFAFAGSVLYKDKPDTSLGTIFHFMGGLLIPGGAMVTLSEFSTGQNPAWPIAVTIGIVTLFYLALNSVHKNSILTFFSLLNGTATLYLLLNAMMQNTYGINEMYKFLTMAVGISYVTFAHASKGTWNEPLFGVLTFLGPLAFLGATYAEISNSLLWQLFYVVIISGTFYLAVYMKAKNVLVMGTLFLIAYVVYITNEYFADSLGWPILLVLLGLFFIALGYISINFNKKYIAN